MRIVVILLVAISMLAWLAFELKDKSRDLSAVLLAFSALLAVLLFGALFSLYGN